MQDIAPWIHAIKGNFEQSYGTLSVPYPSRKLLRMAPRKDAADGRQRAARAVAVRRGELGMTQQELADKAGVDVKTVGSLETRGRWPIARSRVRIEMALGWKSGEMDRIAAAPGPEPQPRVPADVVAVVKKYYAPEQAREIIARLEAIEREQRGEGQAPPAQSAG